MAMRSFTYGPTRRARSIPFKPVGIGLSLLAVLAVVLARNAPDQALLVGLSPRSIITLALAVTLAVWLWRSPALRADLVRFGVVALLVVLLVTGGAAGHSPTPHVKAKPAATANALGNGCPGLVQVQAWLACISRQANKAASHSPTKGGGR